MFVLLVIVIAIVVYCKRHNALMDAQDEVAYNHGCADYDEYLDRYEDRECCEEDY